MPDGNGSELNNDQFLRAIREKNSPDPAVRAAAERFLADAAHAHAKAQPGPAVTEWWVNSDDAVGEGNERAMVVAALLNPCGVFPLLAHVLPEHLTTLSLRAVFGAARDVWNDRKCREGAAVDAKLLATRLRELDKFNTIGGYGFLSDLLADFTPTAKATEHAALVVEAARKRAQQAFARAVLERALDPDRDADEVEAFILAGSRDLLQTSGRTLMRSQNDVAISLVERVRRAKKDGRSPGVSTGLPSLDAILGGMHNGELVLLAARPAMGKTVAAENFVYSAALDAIETANQTKSRPARALFFSQEMPDEEVLNRRVAGLANVDRRDAVNGDLSPEELQNYERAANEAGRAPIDWCDAPQTVEEIAAKARAAKHQHGALSVIAIDYAQLTKRSRKDMDDKDHVGHVATSCKQLAKELAVPVILLSQLNRDLEKRPDKRPMMADLRDSGVLEQAADSIVMLFREWVYDKSKDERATEMIVVKNRHGALDTAHVRFDGPRARFIEDLDAPAPCGSVKARDAAFYEAVARNNQDGDEIDGRFEDRESGEHYAA